MDFTFTPNQELLREKAHRYAEYWKPFADKFDRENKAPWREIARKAGEFDFLGLTLPRKYGGKDLTVLDWTLCVEEIARVCMSWIPAEPFFLGSGPGPMIVMASDNEDAKAKFMPPMVSGDKWCCITVTEPKYGTGMTDLETSAVPDGDGWVINGRKRFISGSGETDLYATFVRFGGIPRSAGIGAVMLEKGMPGLSFPQPPEFIGLRGSDHGELLIENVRIPKENLLLREGHFSKLMMAFNMERMHNAALSLGFAEAAYDEAVKYTGQRVQFGRPVIQFQGVQWMIAEIWTQIEAMRYLVYKAAATAEDGKFPQALDVSLAKLFANEAAQKVTQMALQLHGGDGTTYDFPVQRLVRDTITMPLGGGTPQVLRNVVFSQLLGFRDTQRK